MLSPSSQKDSEQTQLLNMLAEMRTLRKDIGGYIEHYYHNEDTIIIKLTNGILKIKERFLEQYVKTPDELTESALKNLADGFVVSTLM